MANDKWIKRWYVPSSSGDGDYVVGQDAEGNYGCTCKGWTRNVQKHCIICDQVLGKSMDGKPNFCWKCLEYRTSWRTERKDCRHITEVKLGRGKTAEEAVIDKMRGL